MCLAVVTILCVLIVRDLALSNLINDEYIHVQGKCLTFKIVQTIKIKR